MHATQKNFRLAVLPAALMMAFGPALANDEVEELIRPDSFVSVGVGNWSNDRPQQGIYDGMRDEGVYGLVDADIVKRDDATGTWMTLKARNLGLDNRDLHLEYLRQGNIGLSLGYDRISRDNPNTFTTRLQGIGDSTQSVVNTANTTAQWQTVQLGTVRDATTLGFYKNLASGLDFKATFRHEDKLGERHGGRGAAAEFIAEPINSTTRQFEGVLNYTAKKFQLSGGYQGSWYSNSNDLVTIFGGATATTYLSQPLDNQAHKLFLNGGYNFTPTTRGTLKMSYTRATQDETFPTSEIAGLSRTGSPSSLDGEVNTTLVQLGLTSRPIQDLSLAASLRYHNVEDETPVYRFVDDGVCTTAGNCVDNTPFSYKTLTTKLEGTYQLADGYSLTAGAQERRQDRHVPTSTSAAGGVDNQRVVPMRDEVNETTWRLELRRYFSEVLNGSVAHVRSRRTGSNYSIARGTGNTTNVGTTGFFNNLDLISPINIDDRERKTVRLGLDWTPLENLSFQFVAEGGHDQYDTSPARPHGMDEGNVRLYSLDVSYALTDNWQLNAWYSHDRNEAKQLGARPGSGANSSTLGAAVKDTTLEDIGDSLGFGVRGAMTSRVKLGADLQWTRTMSKYDQDINLFRGTVVLPGNLSGDIPDIENRLLRISLFSTYALNKQSDVRLDLIHERWKTDDWSLEYANGAPYTYRTVNGAQAFDGTVVTAKAKQTANFVGVRYIYNFQ